MKLNAKNFAILQTLICRAKHLATNYEIILLTNSKEKTSNISDYTGYSVTSEFFTGEEQSMICTSLDHMGFHVRQFFNEEDFIRFVAMTQEDLSRKIVINSAQKGTKIGRKSLIPALCDLYNIPHTGSNPYIVSLCRDKYRSSSILKQNGVQTPRSWLYQPGTGWLGNSSFPSQGRFIVKPNYEAASIGIDASNICLAGSDLSQKVAEVSSNYRQEVLVEEFIPGYEVEVPVIFTEKPLTFFPVGIKLDGSRKMGDRILDYHLRDVDAYEYFDFCEEQPHVAKKVTDIAEQIARLLSINGFGRIDFRIMENGDIYTTDIATNPHYTEKSSYEFLFYQLGFTYDDLIACLIASSIAGGVES